MKLSIQKWQEKQNFSIKVNKIFNESLLCYIHGACRASLLFSYIAFLTHIKERIISGKKPTNIPQPRWDSIINQLKNDDKWEETVFKELCNHSTPIFKMKEYIRTDIKYWKDRRNDCAHFKDYHIEKHHIESFWSFLKSNLSKINLEGGAANLFNKFVIHFDITRTPPNTDFTYLVKEIDVAVETNKLKDFFKSFGQSQFHFYDGTALSLFNKTLEVCTERVTEKLIQVIIEEKIDLDFITEYPDKIELMNYSKTDIRNIWKKQILGKNSKKVFTIITSLLGKNMIPSSQRKEVFEDLYHSYDQTLISFLYNTPEIIFVLSNSSEFGEVIFKNAIQNLDSLDYKKINPKTSLIVFFVENFPLKKETVKNICDFFQKRQSSQWLLEELERMFEKNPTVKNIFCSIANQNNYIIPNQLK
ncbi:MAG: hypothetical protein ACI86H_002761 [bacterium]|jgi:hypothetical protein